MREAFAHDAVLELATDADERAPAGAVTVALCGSLDHEPPCPLAPHHTGVRADGSRVVVRVLYVTEPTEAAGVRASIEAALASGSFVGPDGDVNRWTVVSSAPGDVRDTERDHAERLKIS